MTPEVEIVVEVLIVELGETYTTTVSPAPPLKIELDPGTYTLRATYPETGETLPDRVATITEGITTREDFYFTAPAPPPEYTLTISTTLGGTTNPLPNTYTYVEGTTVPVTAIPDMGYYFDHWILDGETYTSNPINVLMDKDHSLTAYFSEEAPPPPPTYKLTISSTIGGTTDPPKGIHEYDEGLTVTVTAFSDEGYVFNHWELDGATKSGNPINILMNGDHTLLAVFSVTPPPPCWIATATYGTPLAPQVYVLRRFRNRCLPDPVVNLYYATAHPIAKYISQHTNVRRVVEQLLERLIKTIRRLL